MSWAALPGPERHRERVAFPGDWMHRVSVMNVMPRTSPAWVGFEVYLVALLVLLKLLNTIFVKTFAVT